MLITLHNSTNDANYFLQDFNENVIIPKNAVIKLKQAFIPKLQTLDIVLGQNDRMIISANDTTATARNIVIPAGTYTLASLLNTINSTIISVCNNDATKMNWELTPDFHLIEHTEDGINNVKMRLSCNTNSPNFVGWALFSSPDATIWDEYKNFKGGAITTYTLNASSTGSQFVSPVNYFGCSAIEDVGANPLTTYENYWYYDDVDGTDVNRSWFSPTTLNSKAQPPHQNEPYGCVVFTNNIQAGKDYWVGLTKEKPNTAGSPPQLPNTTDLSKMKGVVCMIQKIGVTALLPDGITYTEGSVVVWEWNDVTTQMGIVGSWSGCLAGDTYAICIGESSGANTHFNYFRKRVGNTNWEQGGLQKTPTFTSYKYHLENVEYKLCGGFYNQSASTGVADLQIKNLGASMEATTYKADDFGSYLNIDLDRLKTTLGFEKQVWNDTQLEGLAKIEANNDVKPVHTGMVNIPFVNVNVRNLPLVSYTNTNTAQQGLSISRTIGVLSRFDAFGLLDENSSGNEGVYNYLEQPAIRLNNKEEIILSRMEIDLRNSDGSVPIDLTTPAGFVIELTQSLQDG